MKQGQRIEGELKGCAKEACAATCCDDDRVEEWVNEYFAFHERIKEHLISHGIKIQFVLDRVRFTNCSDGKECKFLKYSLNRDIDARPIDCKIYPYAIDWENIDFDNNVLKLRYWEDNSDTFCPLVKKGIIPEEFRKEVEAILKRDFALLFYGANFEVEFPGAVVQVRQASASAKPQNRHGE